jgi:hypothetical protein
MRQTGVLPHLRAADVHDLRDDRVRALAAI